MRIGEFETAAGQKHFGFLAAPPTRGAFEAHIPYHVVSGANPGPTLVVQAGVSGLEIEPSMTLPKIVRDLEPAQLNGTLVVVPLLNTTGFEFEQVEAVWDGKDLNALGRGKPDGTVSEQLIHRYYTEVIAAADALIDIHTGALWGYFRYAGVYATDEVTASQSLAVALGLPHVLHGQPEDNSLAYAAAQDGKAVVSAWIGGGPGLRDYRSEDAARVQRAVYGALQHFDMLQDTSQVPAAVDSEAVVVLKPHTVIRNHAPRGMVFMDKEKRGQAIAAGEELGYVRHPFTGEVLQHITAPRAGTMLHAGGVWPMLHDDALLAILGDPVSGA